MAQVEVRLTGDNGKEVAVNDAGEVLVSSGPYDLSVFNDMDTADQAYNYYGPRGKLQFVITGLLAFADKDVNDASDTTVVIYEATAPDTATASKVLIQAELGQLTNLPFPNVRILCNVGIWLNAKTNDDDVHLTIFGHYVNLDGKGETS